jgi:hypothetical protein
MNELFFLTWQKQSYPFLTSQNGFCLAKRIIAS